MDWEAASSSSCLFCSHPLLHSRPIDPWDADDPMMGTVAVGDIRLCRSCGWWTATRSESGSWPIGRDVVTSVTHYGAAGSLKELGFTDIGAPLWELRTFLQRDFDRRNTVDPRLFEETVVSIFRSLGYEGHVTAYQNDGGIDAVVYRGSELPIGVQIKRTKNKIEAEQIRSFAGALVLQDFTSGIFLTTSSFTAGAVSSAASYREKLISIELVDATRFFDGIGVAQRRELPSREEALDLLSGLEKLHSYVSPPPEEWLFQDD